MAPTIRLATPDDAASILEIYAPFCRDTPVSFETEPPTLEEVRYRIEKTLPAFPWLICDRSGLVLGYAYASKHRERTAYDWSVDVSVYVREGHRGGGVGRALYTSLFALLRLQGYHNAVAGITIPNPASEGLHRSMGFQPIGAYRNIGYKCGGWHDVAWSQLALREPRPDPDRPRDLASILDTPGWERALTEGIALLDRRT